MSEWFDISTAPKDGTIFAGIIGEIYPGIARAASVSWLTKSEWRQLGWKATGGEWGAWSEDGPWRLSTYEQPSFWQPLPHLS